MSETRNTDQARDACLDLQSWQLRHIALGLAQLKAGQGIPRKEIEDYLDTWGTEP